MRHELHAQNLPCQCLDLVERLGELDAAAFAAAPRMNLGLNHPDWPPQLACGLHRLIDAKTWDAAWNRNSVPPEDVFALVLVDFHAHRSDGCNALRC